jgi:long-chain acyl-CoA synthetase
MEIKRLFDIPLSQNESYPKTKMFSWKENDSWVSWSTHEFIERVNELSRALIHLGVGKGENVALVSPNRVEWNLVDIAIQQTGAIVVPVYPNISSKDYVHIFNDSKIRYAFVGTDELYDKISGLKDQIPSLMEIYHLENSGDRVAYFSILPGAETVSMDQLNEIKATIKNEELATIIYTSGTTGNPKGVMLSHNNLLSNVLTCREIIPADGQSRVLTFLPSCHVYERMLQYLYMYCGAEIYFAESMDTIGANIKEVKPHVFTAVPRLMEKVFDKIMITGNALTGIKRKLFFWAVELAESYSPKGNSAYYNFKLKIARKLIFSKWQEALGGNVHAIASGSAALQPKIAQIFLAAGIPVLEGYGLTETSPVISVNCLKKGIRIGTVGPLIPGVQVKIAEDGEILVKGPNVMMGYYNLPDKTEEVMDADGWFHTGDIGTFEEDKFLKITDRKKEIFKTSGGKYIVPQAMENVFKESRFIEQIMVLGEGKNFPAALIVPAYTFIRDWAKIKKLGFEDLSNEELVKQKEVIKRIDDEVEEINKKFGNWEQIKKFHLLPKEMTIEGGELTPTLKLKRKVILEMYKEIVDGFYD